MRLIRFLTAILAVLFISSCGASLPDSGVAEVITLEMPAREEPPAPETGNAETPLHVVALTSPITKNKTATLDAVGKPNTTYSITVIYATANSEARGIEPKKSNPDGQVSWSWKIGASVKPGSYKIVLEGGGETVESFIDVK